MRRKDRRRAREERKGEHARRKAPRAERDEKRKEVEEDGAEEAQRKAPKVDREESEGQDQEEDMDIVIVLRAAGQRIEVEIMEMYSPPRATEEAKRWGRKSGEAMDLTTGWNFRKQDGHGST